MSSPKNSKPKTTKPKTAKPSASLLPAVVSSTDTVIEPAAPVLAREWSLSHPWMSRWIESVTRLHSIVEACEATQVHVIDICEARQTDPEFEDACRIHDEVVDLVITDAVRTQAIHGDIRSQVLYFSQVRSLVFGNGTHRRTEVLFSPEAAEILVRNELAAQGEFGDDSTIIEHATSSPPETDIWSRPHPHHRK